MLAFSPPPARGTGNRVRSEVHYRGQVQGVGFRYSTMSIARRFAVVGFVQNLPDGRVRLIAEGESDEVEGLLQSIAERMDDSIRDIDCQKSTPTGEFVKFDIRY